MTNIDYPKRASYETIQDYVKRLLDWLYDNKNYPVTKLNVYKDLIIANAFWY